MTLLAGLLTSSGFGAIIGLLGSWLTKRQEAKTLALQYQHENDMAKQRLVEAAAEYAHEIALKKEQIEQVQVEGAIQIDSKAMDAFTASIQNDKPSGIKFVDAIRGLMRPAITLYLLAVTTALTLSIHKIVGGLESFDPKELFSLYQQIVLEIIFLCSTAVCWWFGSRPSSVLKHKK
jgi:hypothetical protein